jgi:hypothetical protein
MVYAIANLKGKRMMGCVEATELMIPGRLPVREK